MAKKPASDSADDVLTGANEPERGKPDKASRSEELCHDQEIADACVDLYADIEQGFTDEVQRCDDQLDYWDIYDCKLGAKQFYNGNSQIFVPLVQDAINARKTRFLNQVFPRYGRTIEATSEDADDPHALVALLESYVRKDTLRTRMLPALLVNGDVEGHYNVYTGWMETVRHVAFKTTEPVSADDEDDVEPGAEVTDPDAEVERVIEETLTLGRPYAEVLSDRDVLILPATADSVDEALQVGGSVTILRRWSKAKVRQMIADGEIDKENGEAFVTAMSDAEEQTEEHGSDLEKRALHAAGIQKKGKGFYGIIYETFAMLQLKSKDRRLCRILFAGSQSGNVLSVRRNAHWNDKCPLLSVPLHKKTGVFKGRSKIADVDTLQYQANDATNEGMDSAAYALMPIVFTDPAKNPKVGTMIMDMAAVWETSPQDTQIQTFPPLWKDALGIVASCASQIRTTLTVNPAAITQQTTDKKPTQADVANEQQIDLLTTADAVTVIEEGILTPMIQRWIEYDHQYRDQAVTIRAYGRMGIKAKMEQVEPIQFDSHVTFRWYGVEQARSAQQMQQQIAVMNVIRGIPPEMYQGYKLNMAPVIERAVSDVFGPELGPLVFTDMRDELSQDPSIENEVLAGGMWMPAHPLDDHQKHIQAHAKAMQAAGGDPSGQFRTHIMAHQKMALEAAQAQVQATQPMPGQQPGQPGGPPGGGQPGISGTPRMGAQPGQQRPAQGPPGMIPHDQMHDPSRMPRQANGMG